MSQIVYALYLIARFLHKMHIPILPKVIQVFIRIIFGCKVPYTAKIGKNTVLGNGGLGLTIHARSVIGENCRIGPCVSIVGSKKHADVPKIGNNVWIGTGARIVGPVVVGNNVMIGANAVVNKDVPDNTLVAGVPAKIIKENIDIKDYM